MAKLISGVNDLATKYPELAKQWHLHKNGNLKPEDVAASSGRKVWWFLPYTDSKTGKHFDFEWEATVLNRTNGRGCPYLSGQAVWEGYNDLSTVNPELAEQLHPHKNGNLKPEDVTANSNKKVWWFLPYDDPITGKHFDFEWEATVVDRTRGSGCPYLSGRAVWKGYNDLSTIRPDLAIQWHPYKNGNLKPEDVTIGSHKKVWWLLSYDDPNTGKHFDFEWEATVASRTRGDGCPYLFGKAVWKRYNDFGTTHPELAKEWNYERNGNLKPEDITAGCNKKVWWLLQYDDPNTGKHFDFEWEASVVSRIQGIGCPYLSGRYAWKGYNDLSTTHPELVKEWNYEKNGNLKPEDVTAGSGEKVWWFLSYTDPKTEMHFDFEWEAKVYSRVNGTGCPFIKSPKIERFFKEFLDRESIVHTPQKKFSGCKDKKKLEFDEYLEKLIKMMEGDGIQHFRIVDHWDKGEESNFLLRRKHDEMKDKFCIRKNIPLLRIPYIYDADKDKNEIEEIIWDFILYNTIPKKIRDFYESEGRYSYIKVLEHFNTKFS